MGCFDDDLFWKKVGCFLHVFVFESVSSVIGHAYNSFSEFKS